MSDESIRIARKNERIEQVKREKRILAMILAGIVAVLIIVLMIMGRKPKILLTVESITMMQDEKVPKLKVNVELKGNKKKVLDKETEYTVTQLAEELKAGENYKVSCKADGKTDGKFKVTIQLSKELQKKLSGEWLRKLEIAVTNGTLTVQNKYGAWDGEKFKKVNGKYAKNEFIPFEGHRYYFGEDGKKVTKEIQVGSKLFTFDKDGKVTSEKYYVDPEKPMIALTFDDGPGPETDRLLDTLEQYHSRATFFMVGRRVKLHPETVKRMSEIGCELGNHTAEHVSLAKQTPEEMKKAIKIVSDRVKEATGGPTTTLIRPPYGDVNEKVKETVPQPMIHWSIDTLDWKTKNVESTIDKVNRATDGDIVLMHDIHKTSVDAAVRLIPKLVEKGYQLVTVSEMAEARGETMNPGEMYFSFYKK